jgi:hypothetical protein
LKNRIPGQSLRKKRLKNSKKDIEIAKRIARKKTFRQGRVEREGAESR